MSQLIQRAREIYRALPITELQKAGFFGDQEHYRFISNYPPKEIHKPIRQEDIFSGEPKERVVNFYVHIPFCTGKCGYCGYDIIPNPPKGLKKEYLKLLKKEVDLLLSQRDLALLIPGYIYFGGGTPTCFTEVQLAETTRLLRTKNEKTLETSPESLTETKLKISYENGVNRISLGVQAYQDRLLKRANRRHDSSEARAKAGMISSFDFREFNIDLMIGLPDQTLDDLEDSLNKSLENNPTSVTVYPEDVNRKCKFASLPRARFPSSEDWLLMQIMAREFFEERGYSQGPIHYFSRVRKQDRAYQEGKWRGLETLALGVSSYQYFNGFAFHNYCSNPRGKDFQNYRKYVNSKRLPIGGGIKLDREEQMAREIILAIKGSGKIERTRFKERFGLFPEETNVSVVKRLNNLGLILVSEDSLSLTSVGELFSEEVARVFFTEETRTAIGNGGYMNFSIQQLPKL